MLLYDNLTRGGGVMWHNVQEQCRYHTVVKVRNNNNWPWTHGIFFQEVFMGIFSLGQIQSWIDTKIAHINIKSTLESELKRIILKSSASICFNLGLYIQ